MSGGRRGVKVHDIEAFTDCFIYCDIDRDHEDVTSFAIWQHQDQLDELVRYLNERHHLVGYNNLAYDGQILEFILDNCHLWRYQQLTGAQIANEISRYSNRTIANGNRGGFPDKPEWKMTHKHLDLFKLWHFDNRARRTRLKDLQVAMDWYNVQDTPIHFTSKITTWEEFNLVRDYCINDIKSTLQFYRKSKEQIDLRSQLSKTFSLNLMSANDPKLGSEIFAKLISERMGISMSELKKMRTERSTIDLGPLLLKNIQFKDISLGLLLETIRQTTIKNTKGGFKKKLWFKGVDFEIGLGGIHACAAPGRYKAGNGYKILDIDVTSFYPNLGIVNGWYPEHLGVVFCEVCKMLFEDRQKIPKKDPRNYAYKIMLNGVYGKSNDKYSYFYDPRYTMQITINGQMLILMLTEAILELSDVTVLQANTDGITILYKEDLEADIYRICDSWMNKTNLKLEYIKYREMIISNVNNYMGIFEDGTAKYKGDGYGIFDNNDPSFKDWHKDPSFRIVNRAISNYFIDNIPVEDTIKGCKDIYQFTGRAKFMSDSSGETRCLDVQNSTLIKEPQQKTTRYLITNKGCQFVKVYVKGDEEQINRGWQVTIFNEYVDKPFNAYDINYKFYIEEANKVIREVEGKKDQLTLF